MLTKLFIGTALLAAPAMCADTTLSGSGSFNVKVMADKPDFMVSNGTVATRVTLGEVSEVSASGAATGNALSSLTSASLTFSGASQVSLTGASGGTVAATQVSFSGQVDVGAALGLFKADVKVTALVFADGGTFKDDETKQDVKVEANTFKWSVKVDGWKFKDAANKLVVSADVKADAAAAAGRRATRILQAANGTIVTKAEGDFTFAYPTTCLADGKTVAVAVDTSSSVKHTVTFPSFTTSMAYDPTVNYKASAGSNSGSVATRAAPAALIAAAVALLWA
jgi:hypothetical protein|eukprot:TRINITY_DN170_c0_g1_i1.p3 TRINITY_DN170_c0_g1~~TRINITY_DN170_c0_g1_i1.p3  ORF type:complete len:281 (-),score=161.41 TRINITY_DN170_c0_g1_i1:46-888(-)